MEEKEKNPCREDLLSVQNDLVDLAYKAMTNESIASIDVYNTIKAVIPIITCYLIEVAISDHIKANNSK